MNKKFLKHVILLCGVFSIAKNECPPKKAPKKAAAEAIKAEAVAVEETLARETARSEIAALAEIAAVAKEEKEKAQAELLELATTEPGGLADFVNHLESNPQDFKLAENSSPKLKGIVDYTKLLLKKNETGMIESFPSFKQNAFTYGWEGSVKDINDREKIDLYLEVAQDFFNYITTLITDSAALSESPAMLALLSYVNGFLEAYAYHSQPEAPIITTKNNADTGSLFSLNVQKHIQPGGYNTQEIGEIILGAVEYTKITHTATIDLQKIAAYTAIKTAWHLLDLAKHSTTEPKPIFEIDNRMTTAKKFLNISGTEELEIFPIRLGLAATPDSIRAVATHDPLRRYTEEEMIRDGHTGLWFKNGDNTYSKIIKPEIEAAELTTDTPIQDIIRSLLEIKSLDETVALSSCCEYLQGFVVGGALESLKLTSDKIKEIQDLYEEALTSRKKREFSLQVIQGILEGYQLTQYLPGFRIEWWEINPLVAISYENGKKTKDAKKIREFAQLCDTTTMHLFKELREAKTDKKSIEICNQICINLAGIFGYVLEQEIKRAASTGKARYILGTECLREIIRTLTAESLPKAPTAVPTAVVMTHRQARLLAKLEQRKKTTAPAGAGREMTPEEREAAEKARKEAEEELLKAGPTSHPQPTGPKKPLNRKLHKKRAPKMEKHPLKKPNKKLQQK